MRPRDAIAVAAVWLIFALFAEVSAETVRVAVCQMQVADGRISENLAKAEGLVKKASGAAANTRIGWPYSLRAGVLLLRSANLRRLSDGKAGGARV